MKRRAPELSQQYIQPLADVFKVLGDPTRLRILRVLMNQDVCVRDIADKLGMGRDGKTVYYSLADAHVFTLLDVGLEHVAE